jgi:hypothetical protein
VGCSEVIVSIEEGGSGIFTSYPAREMNSRKGIAERGQSRCSLWSWEEALLD